MRAPNAPSGRSMPWCAWYACVPSTSARKRYVNDSNCKGSDSEVKEGWRVKEDGKIKQGGFVIYYERERERTKRRNVARSECATRY